VQDYTQDFIKMELTLGIPLYMEENILKYIGGVHSYFIHTIFMFNPNNLDDVYVQDTHFESRGKNAKDNLWKKSVHLIEGKHKGKGKMK